jgi:hypothetical protein
MTNLNPLLAPIAEKFGFDPKDIKVQEAMESTRARFKKKVREEFNLGDDAHVLLLRREFLYTLRKVTYLEECNAAEEKIADKPRTDGMFMRNVAEELAVGIPRSDRDPGYFFDPAKWKVARISAYAFEEKVLRLALFCRGMLAQEKGFEEGHFSYLNAAKRVIQRRADDRGNSRGDSDIGGPFRG